MEESTPKSNIDTSEGIHYLTANDLPEAIWGKLRETSEMIRSLRGHRLGSFQQGHVESGLIYATDCQDCNASLYVHIHEDGRCFASGWATSMNCGSF